MGHFLPRMPVAFTADSDFQTAERSSAHWIDLVVTQQKMSMCVPFPFLFLSLPCQFTRLSDAHLSRSFVFLEVRHRCSLSPFAVSLTMAAILVPGL